MAQGGVEQYHTLVKSEKEIQYQKDHGIYVPKEKPSGVEKIVMNVAGWGIATGVLGSLGVLAYQIFSE